MGEQHPRKLKTWSTGAYHRGAGIISPVWDWVFSTAVVPSEKQASVSCPVPQFSWQ